MTNKRKICNRCGKDLDPKNDACNLARIMNTLSVFDMPGLGEGRHLLPTEDCPGSPSRAQYLEGQPRDTRPGASYDPKDETRYRAAYVRLLAGEDGSDDD